MPKDMSQAAAASPPVRQSKVSSLQSNPALLDERVLEPDGRRPQKAENPPF